MVATSNAIAILRVVIIVQAGGTIALSMLAMGRLFAHPQVVYGSITRKTIAMLCAAYDLGLMAIIVELVHRIEAREPFRFTTILLIASMVIADYALLRIVRRAFRIL